MLGFLASLAAPLIGGLFGQSAQNDQQGYNSEEAALNRSFNSAEALKQRTWQSEMSSTAYQRSTKDMMEAGLNPMLAYQQGGASTPSGASASGSAASVSGSWADKAAAFAQATAASAQARLADSQGDKAKAEAEYIRNSQTPNTAADTALKKGQQNKLDAEVSKIGVEQINISADTLTKGSQADVNRQLEELYRRTLYKVEAETKNLGLSADQIRAQTSKYLVETLHLKLGIPKAQAEAAFSSSAIGKAQPYINSATGALSNLNPLSKILK